MAGNLRSGDLVLDSNNNLRVIYKANFFNPDWYETATDAKDLLHFAYVKQNLGNIQDLVVALSQAVSNISTLQTQVTTLQTQVAALTPAPTP